MSLDVEPRNLRGQDQSDVHLLKVDEAEADAAKYLGVWVGKANLMMRGLTAYSADSGFVFPSFNFETRQRLTVLDSRNRIQRGRLT